MTTPTTPDHTTPEAAEQIVLSLADEIDHHLERRRRARALLLDVRARRHEDVAAAFGAAIGEYLSAIKRPHREWLNAARWPNILTHDRELVLEHLHRAYDSADRQATYCREHGLERAAERYEMTRAAAQTALDLLS